MKRMYRILAILLICATLFSLVPAVGATEMKSAIGYVNASGGLRVRAKPNTSASILTTAYDGDAVVILREVNGWYLVNYNLYIGYVHKDYIVDVKTRENIELGYASVDPSVANMRSAPSTSASLVSQVRCGQKVYIFGFNTGWYKVKYDGEIGYIRSDLLTLLERPEGNRGSTASISSSSSSSSGSSSASSGTTLSLGQQVANTAKKYVGYPYVYGGSTPSGGFDCSGFVMYVYGLYGIKLPHGANSQTAYGYRVSYSELRPGDLVFFGNGGSTITHVGLYIGNDQFVHAENSSTGVVISGISSSYYNNRYITARRIV